VRNRFRRGAGFIADPRQHCRRPRIKNPAARKLEPQKISKGEINAILKRLQEIDDWSKKFGCRMGLIGDNGLKVWRYLANSFMANGWACFPSYRHIAKKLNIARSTVGEALRRLKRVGALNWTERQHRINGRRVQGTNLFTIHDPSESMKFMPLLKRVRKTAVDAVANVVKSACPSMSFRETDKRSHGATTFLNNRSASRLEAALARLAANIGARSAREG
jgi:transposase